MEKVEPNEKSTSRYAEASQSPRRMNSYIYWQIHPTGMESVRDTSRSWRMTERSTVKSDS